MEFVGEFLEVWEGIFVHLGFTIELSKISTGSHSTTFFRLEVECTGPKCWLGDVYWLYNAKFH